MEWIGDGWVMGTEEVMDGTREEKEKEKALGDGWIGIWFGSLRLSLSPFELVTRPLPFCLLPNPTAPFRLAAPSPQCNGIHLLCWLCLLFLIFIIPAHRRVTHSLPINISHTHTHTPARDVDELSLPRIPT